MELDAGWIDLKGVFTNILSNIVWAIIIAVAAFLLFLLKRRMFALKRSWRARMLATFSAGSILAIVAHLLDFGHSVAALSFVFVVAAVLLYESYLFSRLGFVWSELTVKSGTDYEQALSVCQNGFYLLGTGGYKITHAKNFAETMAKCSHPTATVRFLLSKPDNKLLLSAEKAANIRIGTYTEKVLDSLKVLRKLKMDRAFNFEVRFYPSSQRKDFENFRLMIIDGNLLLLSYNVYGAGDGSDFPQIILRNAEGQAMKSTFFFPFLEYFNQLWESSEPWDFESYVS